MGTLRRVERSTLGPEKGKKGQGFNGLGPKLSTKKRIRRRSRGFGLHFEDETRGLCASLRSVSKNGSVAYTVKASCIEFEIRTKTQTKDRQGLTSTWFARPERVRIKPAKVISCAISIMLRRWPSFSGEEGEFDTSLE